MLVELLRLDHNYPSCAIDRNNGAIPDKTGPIAGPDHGRDSKFPGDHGSMGQLTPRVGYNGPYDAKVRSPRWRQAPGHEDFAILKRAGFLKRLDDSSPAPVTPR